MISRTITAVDRIATAVVALILLGGATFGLWWWTGYSPVVTTIDTTDATSLIDANWWPWASATVGVLLAFTALAWLLAHVGRSTVNHLRLTGSSLSGAFSVDASKIADAAADILAGTLGIRSTSGIIYQRRGQTVVRLTALIEPEADLTTITSRADQVAAELVQVLGRRDLACSIELKVAARGRDLPRAT